MKYCFGIDIGGTTVKMGLFQEDGELLDKWEIKTRTENQGEAILPDIAQAVKAKMAEKKLVKEQIIFAFTAFAISGRIASPWILRRQ